jgi:hypothetical protein
LILKGVQKIIQTPWLNILDIHLMPPSQHKYIQGGLHKVKKGESSVGFSEGKKTKTRVACTEADRS